MTKYRGHLLPENKMEIINLYGLAVENSKEDYDLDKTILQYVEDGHSIPIPIHISVSDVQNAKDDELDSIIKSYQETVRMIIDSIEDAKDHMDKYGIE